MKKYKITVLVCIILALSLLITLVVVSNIDKGNTTLPTWQQKPADYVTSTSSIGTIKRTVQCEGRVNVDYNFCDVYTFTNKDKENLLVSCGDIVLPDSSFFEDESITNKYLGRVENIVINENAVQVVVSNFEYLQCQLKIPQEKACDIVIGQKAKITFNDRVFDGFVREKDYILSDEGFLNIVVAINRNNTIIVNASVIVDVILLQKENVLIVPSDALIANQYGYFVDVLNDGDKIERREVAIGIFGDDFVEIKSGLLEGEKVLINQYE